MSTRAAVAALALCLACAGGFFAARLLTPAAPSHVTHEAAAPAVTQPDGSTVLARAESRPTTEVKPRAKVPAGAKVERLVQLEVTPTVPGDTAHVELSLVRSSDDTRRVVVYSDNAEVAGLDIPVEMKIEQAKKWAVGVYVNPARPQARGVFVDRDVGRVRLGAELGQHERGGAEVRLKVGLTF